jgi:ABC-type glycerol-3-phosphate transport system substrate-binding protein
MSKLFAIAIATILLSACDPAPRHDITFQVTASSAGTAIQALTICAWATTWGYYGVAPWETTVNKFIDDGSEITLNASAIPSSGTITATILIDGVLASSATGPADGTMVHARAQ